MALTRRTHILLDEERHEFLRRRAAATGRSVGDLIREAIDEHYAGEADRERAAAERQATALASFLAAEPLAVGEWNDVEKELETLYEHGFEEPD